MCHYVKNHFVGLVHTICPDAGEVVDATIDIVLDDAFDVGDVTVLNGKHGAEYGSGNA